MAGPPPDPEAVARAAALLAPCGPRLRRSFPLAPLTSFRVGGPAALYLEAESDADLEAAARAVGETGIPWTVLGKGSNVLVADAGFPGLVIRLGRGYRWVAREGTRLRAGGAIPLPALAGVALSHGLAGLEFGVAIPASLGGAVRMNAGAHGRSMEEVVETVEVFVLDREERVAVAGAEAGFAYRRSGLPETGVVVGATLALHPGDREEIRRRMDEAREWRRATQPLAEPNCGSVFKNPPGDHAARLIEAAGAKGMRVGGAVVSPKHANFIVAGPGASAADVARLIRAVQEAVRARFGVELEPEVQFVGDVGDVGVSAG
ncbi:MAG TPA: UDP-N-acetylmuramate dehydrogenase [Actinomycetota bacterium]|nr:UDP-N-acetylmuramate dehydrogenase [Actinomycetota bacterium]